MAHRFVGRINTLKWENIASMLFFILRKMNQYPLFQSIASRRNANDVTVSDSN
jgi:hypothetical protein